MKAHERTAQRVRDARRAWAQVWRRIRLQNGDLWVGVACYDSAARRAYNARETACDGGFCNAITGLDCPKHTGRG